MSTGGMFVRIDHEFINNGGLSAISGSAYKVYSVLLMHIGTDGTCFPSVSRIRKYTGLGNKAVSRAIAELESSEFISVSRHNGASNRYHVVRPQKDMGRTARRTSKGNGSKAKPVSKRNGTRVESTLGPVSKGHTKKNQEVEPLKKTLPPASKEADSSRPKAARDYTSQFEQFWDAYPRRNGCHADSKADAFDYWQRLPEGDRADVMVGVPNYAATVADFPKDAVWFLKPDERHWLDYQEPADVVQSADPMATEIRQLMANLPKPQLTSKELVR